MIYKLVVIYWQSLFEKDTVVHNSRVAEATLQEREKKAYEAKAGVRRRRGPRMQVSLELITRTFWLSDNIHSYRENNLFTGGRGMA